MYQVEIHNQGSSLFKVRAKDYEFNVDTKDQGISPPDTLLAALGTCLGVYLRKYCEGAKLELKEFQVNVQAEFSKDRPVCFRDIRIDIDLKGFQLEDRRKAALLEFIKNCPVHHTLQSKPQIQINLL